ncbi:hypothetical protein LXA47_21615, partial [Massilia sp. P8910]|uniref:hypothetical protein n=1 Tax=Massilia antarctica TaxID=2765360 RepID=UPI001E5D99BE
RGGDGSRRKPSNYSIPETLVFYIHNDFVSCKRATIVQATLNALQSEGRSLSTLHPMPTLPT